MAIEMSDLMGSNDSGNAQTNNADDTETTTEISLAPVFEEIGADPDRTRDIIRESDNADDIEQLAKDLRDDDELFAILEEYRRYTDLRRILENHLYNYDGDFSKFRGRFWGDSDDPEPDTYNYAQQQSRDAGGNLYYYKAMFPEPVENYWDSDAVLWQERPDDDTDIFVTANFVDNFSQFTMEVDGETVPRPPTDEEIAQMDSGSDEPDGDDLPAVPIDTTEVTIAELEDELEHLMPGLDREQVENLMTHEKANKDRKGARQAIQTALDALDKMDADDSTDEPDDSEASGSTDSGVDDEKQANVGRLAGELGEHPDMIRGMLEHKSPDEVREILG